jgi:hypothetical protein
MSQDLLLRNTKMEAFGGFDLPSQEFCEVANDLLTQFQNSGCSTKNFLIGIVGIARNTDIFITVSRNSTRPAVAGPLQFLTQYL